MMETEHKHGMTASKQQELFAIGQNPQLRRNSDFNALHSMTVVFLRHAIDLVKANKKDSARNWYRYFDQSQIYRVLHDSGAVNESKLTELRLLLTELKYQCHPEDRINLETDLQEIRAMLVRLLELQELNSAPVFSFYPTRNLQLTSTRN